MTKRSDQPQDGGTNFSLDSVMSFILEHHGIKGMKWGVRRSKKQLESAHVSEIHSHDSRTVRDIQEKSKAHGTSSLSNQELQTAIARLNLEQQYSRLTTPQKSAGQKFVSDLLTGFGKQQVNNLATKAATNAGKKIMLKAAAKKAARTAVKVTTGV